MELDLRTKPTPSPGSEPRDDRDVLRGGMRLELLPPLLRTVVTRTLRPEPCLRITPGAGRVGRPRERNERCLWGAGAGFSSAMASKSSLLPRARRGSGTARRGLRPRLPPNDCSASDCGAGHVLCILATATLPLVRSLCDALRVWEVRPVGQRAVLEVRDTVITIPELNPLCVLGLVIRAKLPHKGVRHWYVFRVKREQRMAKM